jgi:hypothetical protein
MKIKPLSIEILLLIILLSSSNHSSEAQVGPTSPNPPMIGVRQGDWAIYEYNSYITEAYQHPTDSFLPPTRISQALYRIEVLKTTENNLTFQRWIQTNHTYPQMTQDWVSHGTITANPDELYSDPETTYIQVFFSGTNIGPEEQLPTFFGGDIPIQVTDTQVLRIGRVDREVIHVNINYSRNVTSVDGLERRIALGDFFYDKETGLMVRWDYSYTELRYGLQNQLLDAQTLNQSYDLRETNVWSEPIWLRRDVLGSLDVVLLLLVIVLGIALLQRRGWMRK